MFYPELSPAMRWQLEQHQKMYSMYHSMESGKMALGDQYGETWMMILLVEDADEDEDVLIVPLYGVRQDGLGRPIW